MAAAFMRGLCVPAMGMLTWMREPGVMLVPYWAAWLTALPPTVFMLCLSMGQVRFTPATRITMLVWSALLGWALVTAVTSDNAFEATANTLGVVGTAWILALLYASDPEPEQTFRWLASGTLGLGAVLVTVPLAAPYIGSVVSSGVGLAETYSIGLGPLVLQTERNHEGRYASLLSTSGSFSSFLFPAFALAVWRFLVSDSRPVLRAALVALFAVGLWLAKTRNALVASAMVAFLMAAQLRRVSSRASSRLATNSRGVRSRSTWGVVAGVAIVLLLVAAWSARGGDLAGDVLSGRGAIYTAALMAIADSPITGHGIKQGVAAAGLDVTHLHSAYIQAAADIGVPGAVLLLAVWAVALVQCTLALRVSRGADGPLYPDQLALVLSVLAALLVHQLSSSMVLQPVWLHYYWACLTGIAGAHWFNEWPNCRVRYQPPQSRDASSALPHGAERPRCSQTHSNGSRP